MSASTPGASRLAAFFRLASESNWCHQWGCTTCGSQEFYGGLQGLVDEMGGGLGGKVEIAKLLAVMTLISNEALVENVLIWLTGDIPADDLGRHLGRTDAGALFSAINVAKATAQARRQAHNLRNDPAFVEAERERKKTERGLAHQERLAAKALRDAARAEKT